MKIQSVEVIPVEVPDAGPAELGGKIYVAVAVVRTSDGIQGLGHTMTLFPKFFRTLVSAVEELGEVLVGEDPCQPERNHRKMTQSANWFGPGGMVDFAACALDIAGWDLMGKAAGQPLYRLLGGHKKRVGAYVSGELGRQYSLDQLGKKASSLADQGWGVMKMNLGAERSPQAEAARVRVVREAVGANVGIMVDVNSRWSPAQAIRVGRHLEEYHLFWLEDPTVADDLEGLAEITRALDLPIATGEKYYGLSPWQRVLRARALDIVMVDLMRAGGITPFMKVAALCDSFGIPVASHTQHEVFAQLIAAIPNGLIVEYMPWSSKVFGGVPELQDGDFVMNDRPGTGLELDEHFLAQHRVKV